MSILYKTVKLKNSLKPEKPDMFIAVGKSRGELSLDSLSKRISYLSTVSRADVYAVLTVLCDTLPDALKDGNIVRLGNLGSFMIKLKSETATSAKEINAHKVKGLKLIFRPSKEFKTELEHFELEKYEP